MVNQVESSVFSQKSQNYKKTKIQNLIFPKIDICTVDELYFRTNSKVLFNYEHQILQLNQGGYVSFDTYFNGFSVEKWKSYTKIKSIGTCLELQGSFKIQICNINLGEAKTVVLQKIIKNTHLDTITVLESFDISSYAGMIYIEIEALNNNCQIRGGCFYSYTEPENHVKLAVVICTYKREYYIYKNINLLEKYLLNQSGWEDKLQIFVIDNGNTLEKFDNALIHLVSNKNAGGSGGFAKGILEVLDNDDKFSHIILMDDDVTLEPEIFDRLWHFLSFITDSNLSIGGAMLRLDKKNIQHAKGEVWHWKDSYRNNAKGNIDLVSLKSILSNETIHEYINFNGFWLICFPTEVFDKFGLIYPFFKNADDIEFCIRTASKFVTLNGFCIWHEPFENKYVGFNFYYMIRNELILYTLHFNDFNRIIAIKWLFKKVFIELALYRYETAYAMLQGGFDFLKGPDYIALTSPEQKHQQVSKLGERTTKYLDAPFISNKYEEGLEQTESKLSRWIRYITLNGHLLPDVFLFKNDNLMSRGYRILPWHGSRSMNVFRSKKVLYYNLPNQEGFIVEFSRRRFFKVLSDTMWLAVLIFLKFPKLKKMYVNTLHDLTNKTFWEKYLEIEKSINNKNHV